MNFRTLRSILAALVAIAALVVGAAPAAAQVTFPRTCSKSLAVNSAAAGTTGLLGPGTILSGTPTAAQLARGAPDTIFVCGYIIVATVATTTAELEYGSSVSTPCDTSPVALTPVWSLPSIGSIISDIHDQFVGLVAPAGSTLCLVVTGGPAQAMIYYDNNPL